MISPNCISPIHRKSLRPARPAAPTKRGAQYLQPPTVKRARLTVTVPRPGVSSRRKRVRVFTSAGYTSGPEGVLRDPPALSRATRPALRYCAKRFTGARAFMDYGARVKIHTAPVARVYYDFTHGRGGGSKYPFVLDEDMSDDVQ